MFGPQGPSLRELAVQALSSVEHGYDLLAPKFDHTPFRTPDAFLEGTASVLGKLGPFEDGLDLCCGTGAGTGVLSEVCRRSVTGIDFSAGMLEVARRGTPEGRGISWVRGDVRTLPFADGAFDLAVSFGAFGHFLPAERPGLFARVHALLRPGGCLAFPLTAPPRPGSRGHLMMLGFDVAMRVRNAVRRPPFVMYYRTFRFGDVRRELTAAGFGVQTYVLPEFGRRPDGSPRCRLVVARRPETAGGSYSAL